jgi:oligopeptide/dipeptide ABC transporter ATP-binding protein
MGKERLNPVEGHPPDMINPPAGCPFAARCSEAMEICNLHKPQYEKISENHSAACWLLYNREGGEK